MKTIYQSIGFIFVINILSSCSTAPGPEVSSCTEVTGPYGGRHWHCPGGIHYFEPPAHWHCWVNWHGRRVCRWAE